jgi:hypothetical protein
MGHISSSSVTKIRNPKHEMFKNFLSLRERIEVRVPK